MTLEPMVLFVGVAALASGQLAAQELRTKITGSDGFELPAVISLPEGTTADKVDRVVIVLHGSGPHGMDGELQAVTKGKKSNKVFRQYGDALRAAGFAVVRYDKRSYVWQQRIRQDRSALQSKEFQAFAANTLETFVKDAEAAVRLAREKLPKARVRLLGLSQGTWIGLQVAHRMPEVEGVALVGFYTQSVYTLSFQQIVNRPMAMLRRHDTDGDGRLSQAECAKVPALASLPLQMRILDIDGDEHLSFDELRGGNLVNLLSRDPLGPGYRPYEASQPPVQKILQEAKFKVAFYQGLLDNQTPAYHTHAVKILAENVWKKPAERMSFRFFPRLGHVLDRRDGYYDMLFRRVDEKALAELTSHLRSFF